jgi:preprotein translocase subunit SecF
VIYDKFADWYSHHYRKLMIIPLIVFLACAGLMVEQFVRTGELFPRDIELSGGVMVTVETEEMPSGAKAALEDIGLAVKEIHKYGTGELIAVAIEGGPEFNETEIVNFVNATFPGSKYDTRTVGPSMGESFTRSAVTAIVIAFTLMALMLWFIFKKPIVALTVVLSGFLNVFETSALMVRFGLKLAPHTIGALLMLMGWSVDSEVLFDTKLLKDREGEPKQRALKAMKTAMTMSSAVFASLLGLYIISTASLVEDIALILLIGVFFDTINTWFQSLGMVLWYAEGQK